MDEETWAQLGESIDISRGDVRPVIPQLEIAPPTFEQQRRKREGEARARALYKGRTEAEYEAEMDVRIVTESAAIRAEWDVQTEQSRRVVKTQELEVPRVTCGDARCSGIDFTR